MKKIGILIAIVIIAAVVVFYPKDNTNSETLVFTGENDNWQATLTVNTTETWSEDNDYDNSMDKVEEFYLTCE